MSYYDNPQWSGPAHNNWEHQAASTSTRTAAVGATQSQDNIAFSYQFDEVGRAYENLQKSGKGYGMGVRRHARTTGPPNLHNFYTAQRHQPSRGTNEAKHFMQTKRRMAAQRERELRNRHTEQQYQRNDLVEAPQHGGKHMSEEETRELIARQRSALYGEGTFADKSSYVDESGIIRPGAPRLSGPSSIRGPSPLTFDGIGHAPGVENGTPSSAGDRNGGPAVPSPRPQSTTSPQTAGPANKALDHAIGLQSRTSNSSPTGASPPRDMAPGAKHSSSGASVAPIGTRPTGSVSAAAPGKRSTPPLSSPGGGWARGNGVWGQTSGLGAQASVWG